MQREREWADRLPRYVGVPQFPPLPGRMTSSASDRLGRLPHLGAIDPAKRWAPPAWRKGALVSVGERLLGDLLTLLRRRQPTEVSDWEMGFRALRQVFGLDRGPHMLRTPPILWASYTEPQITTGLAYFLNAPEPRVKTCRVRALLAALGVPLMDASGAIEVTAEAWATGSGEARRIDLRIRWKDGARCCWAAAIEAKFDHKVTCGQLEAYRRHLHGVNEKRRSLVVVSPDRERVADALQRNPEWRWMGWRHLLVAHERALPVSCDDEAYRQYRSTLWHKAG